MSLGSYVKKYRDLFKSKSPATTAHTEKGHFYVSPQSQEKYHSVTYFTSFIKDPSLANWKMNRAVEYIDGQVQAFYDPLNIRYNNISKENWDNFIKESKLAPEGEFHQAGDIGTQTHNWRQQFFQHWIDKGWFSISDSAIDGWPLPGGADPEVISGCRAIKRFLKETGYIPVACELALVDDELKVGGTIDDLGVFPDPIKIHYPRIDDVSRNYDFPTWMENSFKIKYRPYLGFVDLKTSNQGKKPAYAFQVRGFYQRMIRKTFGVKPKKTYILHTSKEDGTYKLIDLTEMKFLEKDAEYLVHCSRSWDKVVEGFKPKVISI